MTRSDRPGVRLIVRALYYLAILVAVAAVASITGRVDTGFVYQAF